MHQQADQLGGPDGVELGHICVVHAGGRAAVWLNHPCVQAAAPAWVHQVLLEIVALLHMLEGPSVLQRKYDLVGALGVGRARLHAWTSLHRTWAANSSLWTVLWRSGGTFRGVVRNDEGFRRTRVLGAVASAAVRLCIQVRQWYAWTKRAMYNLLLHMRWLAA